MYEVFTFGGGIYLVNIFNAVAAIAGSSAMANLVTLMGGIGLAWVLFRTSFGGQWQANVQWFVLFMVIYMVMFVPRVTVMVTDKINPALTNRVIDNVPYGLAWFASTTSGVGEGLTRLMETSFALPDDLQYQNNGMIFGARLLEESTRWRITDSTFAGNMSRMTRQCVFYGILLGQIDLNDLKKTGDLWGFIQANAGSPIRAFEYRSKTTGTAPRRILTCTAGIAALSAEWPQELSQATGIFGLKLFPGMPRAQARTALLARLPVSHDYIIGIAKNATATMRQQMMINAIDDGMRDWATNVGNEAALKGYMQARADLQTAAVYKTTGLQAEKWVPLLRIVFECLYYGAFPIAFLMMLSPMGLMVFRGYFSGFVWLQSWAPLYAILHYVIMEGIGTDAQSIMGGNSVAIVSQLGMRSIIQETSAMAGYLSMSVPFIAFGIAFGAMRFAGLATSMLAPSQRAAGTAAEETTSGNISLGNTSQDNHSFNSMQGNQYAMNTSFGAGQVSMQAPDGSMQNLTSGGRQTIQTGDANSSISTGINFSGDIADQYRRLATEQSALSENQSTQASHSLSSAINSGASAMQSMSHDITSGAGWTTGMSSEERAAVSNVMDAAHDYAMANNVTEETALKMITGASIKSGDAEIGKRLQSTLGISASGNAEGVYNSVSSETWKEAQNFAERRGLTEDFNTAMRAAEQHSGNVSDREGSSYASQYSHNITDASTLGEQAAASLNKSGSFASEAARTENNAASVNQNANQAFVEYLQHQVVHGQLLGMNGAADLLHSTKYADQQTVRSMANDFIESRYSAAPLPANNLEGQYGEAVNNIGISAGVAGHMADGTINTERMRSPDLGTPGSVGNQVENLQRQVRDQQGSTWDQVEQGKAAFDGDNATKRAISEQAEKSARQNIFSGNAANVTPGTNPIEQGIHTLPVKEEEK